MPNRTGYIYDDLYLEHELEPFHPESPLRLAALHALFSESGLLEKLVPVPPFDNEKKLVEQIELIHTREHIRNVQSCLTTGNVARHAVAGVLGAVDAVCGGKIDNAFCAVRPPGHHAHNDAHRDGYCKGEGFCFFNNVAIAARYAQKTWKLKKILIVDWDYHHGNGTEEAFYSDPSVFYFSTHRLTAYPGTGHHGRRGDGRGAGYNLNVPLPAPDQPYGTVTDEHLVAAFEKHLLPRLEEVKFVPDLVLVSAGFDSREKDFLGDFTITDRGFHAITKKVMNLARETCAGRIVSVLEGGYNPEGLASAAQAHVKALVEER
jgi:acetoin utilization deacetylase AcuC-like enzyme